LIDERPDAWPVYSDTFRTALIGALSLIEQNEQYQGLMGHWPINRFGNPMSRRGRGTNCKNLAWREKEHVCENCGEPVTWGASSTHHIVQVVDGGTDDLDNLALLCANCHSEMHNGEAVARSQAVREKHNALIEDD
jgi:hypothetical protein